MDLAARYNLTIEQGTTFERTFRWEDSDGAPVDISSYFIRMSIRGSVDATAVLATSTGDTPTLTIAKTGVPGVFTISMSSFYTSLLNFVLAHYDIEMYTDAEPPVVYRIFQGSVTLNKEVTQE